MPASPSMPTRSSARFMSSRRLIIFTRYPVPGKVKTRLIPALGGQGAADLHRMMTEHTLEVVLPLSEEGMKVEVRYEGGDPGSMREWLGSGLSFAPQGTGCLGSRMERAFRSAFDEGALQTVIVGSDCPGLTVRDILEAYNLLGSNPVVLGPALDGGYYLVGLRAMPSDRLYEALFSGIPWGSGDVLSVTVKALAGRGIDVGLLDEKPDVDKPEDLIHWERIKSEREDGQFPLRTGSGISPAIPSSASISVIIPALNEGGVIGGLLAGLRQEEVEVIVADGGSSDRTLSLCREAGVTVVRTPPGRALQMNSGARAASGQILWFLHADVKVPEGFCGMIRGAIASGAVAGAFSAGVDSGTLSMRLIERAANMRVRRFGIIFGDQGIFARSDVFRQIGGFPEIPVMEDFELVRGLKRAGRFVFLKAKVIASARRWQVNGIWRTTLMNQVVTWLYVLGVSPEVLGRWYKKKMGGRQ